MMSTLSVKILILVLLVSLISSSNPVKINMILVMISVNIFFMMYLSSSQVWFPILFFLIFMGGILMMFMILSSILPNEKNVKMKKLFYLFPLMITISFSWSSQPQITGAAKMVKSMLDSSSSMVVLMLTMMMYFFIALWMLSKEETPMRNVMC